jgi:8-amino-7-oxononanoate synthase
MSDWIDEALAQRRAAGLVRVRRAVLAQAGGRVRLAGRWLVNFASNDYLALATDPRLARAAARAARRYGTGATASPLIVGWSKPMRALERALADWEQCPRALCFASGFAANLGVVTALAGRGDVIFSDELNHASLIDGCRLSRASVQIYRHADANHLADLLAQHAAGARRLLIVSDSVFSMDGDLAPVPALAELAQRYGAMLVLDEAHATGILGAQGSGLAELHRDSLSPLGERFVKVGTLSKALGSQGGYVCASKQVVRYLLNTARPYIYSTGLAPPVAAAARCAVGIARAPEAAASRGRVLALARELQTRLRARGWTVPATATQIVPIVVGSTPRALDLSRRLARAGLLVPAIRPPTVPAGTARLRVSLTAAHTPADVLALVEALGHPPARLSEQTP